MKPAGFWIRFLAYIIDSLIVGIPMFIIQMILFVAIVGESYSDYLMGKLNDPTLANSILIFSIISFIISLAVEVSYFGLLTASDLQGTIGKKLLGLKVVNEKGEKVSKGQAIGRYFAYLLSALILYIGFIMIAFGKKQGLHDKICKTYVVYRG
jgi:uncharacterized RDD family membrane protein YckC